jgi:hypothetical protein
MSGATVPLLLAAVIRFFQLINMVQRAQKKAADTSTALIINFYQNHTGRLHLSDDIVYPCTFSTLLGRLSAAVRWLFEPAGFFKVPQDAVARTFLLESPQSATDVLPRPNIDFRH